MISSILKKVNPYYKETLKKKLGIYKYFNEKIIEKKVIFIHIPKSAGTAITKALYGTIESNHNTCSEYMNENKDTFFSFFRFSFVRNPYSRCYSAYNYLQAGGKGPMDIYWRQKYTSAYATFDEFVAMGLENAIKKRAVHFIPQNEFIFDKNDALMIDFMGRYENIEQDISYLRTKIDFMGDLEVINKGPDNSLKFISEESKSIISSLYKKDFELLDFSK